MIKVVKKINNVKYFDMERVLTIVGRCNTFTTY
jgi:hypothetical protein